MRTILFSSFNLLICFCTADGEIPKTFDKVLRVTFGSFAIAFNMEFAVAEFFVFI